MSSLTTENILLQQINELAHLTSSKLAPPNTFTAGELRLLLVDAQQKLNALVINTTPSLASRLNQRADLLRRIFSFHAKNPSLDYIDLRSSSKYFHRALPPPPLWTSFPHSNHATLQSLVNRLEELRGDEESSGNVPSVLFIEEGEHGGEGYIKVKKPLSVIG